MSVCFQRCRSFFQLVTVEPVLLIYMLASFLQFPATQGVTFLKICLLKFNDSSLCQELRQNGSFHDKEMYIQSKTSLWIIFLTVSQIVPSIVTTAFIGSWGDKIDRKVPLVLPCFGGTLSALCFLINNIYIRELPLPVLLLGPILNGLTGGYVAMMMASFSYVTHVTDTRSRTTRVAVVEAMTYVAGTCGVILLGVFLDQANFSLLFTVTSSLFTTAFLYSLVFVKKLPMSSLTSPHRQGLGSRLCYYLSLSHVKQSVICIFRRRHGKNRLFIWIQISVMAILMICTSGLMDTLLLFVKHSPLSWPYSLYGYLQGLHNGLRSLMLVSLLPVLKKFGLRDSTLVIAGLVSRMAGLVLLGFSGMTWMVFLVPVLSMLEGYSSAGCRSLISTMVDADEQGKIFGALASVESLASLVATVTFNNIYSVTQSFYPGLTFHIMAGLCCVCVILMIIVHAQYVGGEYILHINPVTEEPCDGRTIQKTEQVDQVDDNK